MLTFNSILKDAYPKGTTIMKEVRVIVCPKCMGQQKAINRFCAKKDCRTNFAVTQPLRYNKCNSKTSNMCAQHIQLSSHEVCTKCGGDSLSTTSIRKAVKINRAERRERAREEYKGVK